MYFLQPTGLELVDEKTDKKLEGTDVPLKNEFHIDCGLGDGSRTCSKNGPGPVTGVGPIDSFPPSAPSNMKP